ncbi:MAG: hypothetical protein KAT62_05715 [Desulfuromonadales bacterium]|nr:hypothetical protein [Desulfuromonadales bacterium]
MKHLRGLLTIVLVFIIFCGWSPIATADGIENSPPRIVSVAFVAPYIHRGVDIEVIPEAEDADDDDISIQFRWFLNGTELLENNTSLLEGDRFSKGDRIALWVIPSDQESEGAIFYGAEFEIPNAPPEFTTSPPLSFEATEYVYSAQASDPDGDQLNYLLESAPEGMTIEGETGDIHWSINEKDAGDHVIKIVAQDAEGARAVQEYSLNLSIKRK